MFLEAGDIEGSSYLLSWSGLKWVGSPFNSGLDSCMIFITCITCSGSLRKFPRTTGKSKTFSLYERGLVWLHYRSAWLLAAGLSSLLLQQFLVQWTISGQPQNKEGNLTSPRCVQGTFHLAHERVLSLCRGFTSIMDNLSLVYFKFTLTKLMQDKFPMQKIGEKKRSVKCEITCKEGNIIIIVVKRLLRNA